MTGNEIFTEPTPESRAAKAEAVVRERWESDEDLETSIMDMVADTMHLCHIKNLSFKQIINRAEDHFLIEIEEQRGGKDDKCNTDAPDADAKS